MLGSSGAWERLGVSAESDPGVRRFPGTRAHTVSVPPLANLSSVPLVMRRTERC